ncbi:MAG: MarR family transcriptional regulator [Actinomycetota bacterium]|nr:MarR family transcriptional regulator [Actinomycetota bacterium]
MVDQHSRAERVRAAWHRLFGLMLSAKTRERFGHVAAELGFTPGQLQAVLDLSHAGRPLSMRELAEQLDVDASYITGIVDNLERRGHVVRQPSPTDRRVKLVSLTDDGWLVHERAFERFSEPPEGVLDELDDAELDALGSLLAKVVPDIPTRLPTAPGRQPSSTASGRDGGGGCNGVR